MDPALILRRIATGFVPVAALLLFLMASLWLMADATQNSARFGRMFSTLVALNVLSAALLLFLIGSNVLGLLRQLQRGVIGARMTARMVILFVLLAVAPVSVVYYFSLQFLHRGIDNWFDVRVSAALEDALELGRAALDVRSRDLLRQTEQVSAELGALPERELTARLNEFLVRSGATEVSLFGARGAILASSSVSPTVLVPTRPSEAILLQVRTGAAYTALETVRERGLHVRVVVRVPGLQPDGEHRLLDALYPIPERVSRPAESVQAAYTRYRELLYLRNPLKFSFTLTLSLVLLLSVLTAVWAAFFSARRLTAPIRDLADGTRAVAAGHYGTRLPPAAHDELGVLVDSFNVMSSRIAQARDLAEQSQIEVERQKGYLESILGHLSTGVIALDVDGRVRAVNAAAARILEAAPLAGEYLSQWLAQQAALQPLAAALGPLLAGEADRFSGEVPLADAGERTLYCRGNRLPEAGGTLVVFDDITALIRAQREAAWGEVARRLAHEIKNPLTPIQLAAERLRHKCLPALEGAPREVLDRYTQTIVGHVESMKEMVNAFGDYARAPKMMPRDIDLAEIAREIADLYREADARVALGFEVDAAAPRVHADPARVRQLLHNLLKNAVEALAQTPEPEIRVRVRAAGSGGGAELEVCDNGPGLAPEIAGRVFEPYATTKSRGTGLGLAIVRRIVEEHGAMIALESPDPGGLCVRIRWPAATA